MKSLRKRLSILLVMVLVLSLGVWSGTALAEEADEDSAITESVRQQLDLIASRLDELLQPEGSSPWYYSVMDFDRNGRLEFFSASQHPADRSTNLKVWEVSDDATDLTECTVQIPPDESFPDIISDTADTYHDSGSNLWAYLFYDNVVLSPSEMYTVRCSVDKVGSVIEYTPYAIQHSQLVNASRYVTYMDNDGNPISVDQYNDAAADAFSGDARSTTAFDWITAEDARDPSRLAYSYEVFAGAKPPVGTSPIPVPPLMQHDELTPALGTAGEPNAMYMIITKNPTSEKKRAGESLSFVAGANVYDSAYWTFVDPNGNEFDLDYFQAHFVQSAIDGYYSPVLSISNLDSYMDGWGAYCTFYFDGQIAVTNTAWMTVRS